MRRGHAHGRRKRRFEGSEKKLPGTALGETAEPSGLGQHFDYLIHCHGSQQSVQVTVVGSLMLLSPRFDSTCLIHVFCVGRV